MSKTIIGKVGMILKGEYNASTQYTRLDVVTYQGSSYACLKDCKATVPTDTSYWQLVSQKGDKGDMPTKRS